MEEIPVEDQQMKLRKFFTADEEGMVKVDQDLIHAIRERYQELLKELWENQGHLDDFNFSEEEKTYRGISVAPGEYKIIK